MSSHPPARFRVGRTVKLTQYYEGGQGKYIKGDTGEVRGKWQTGEGNAYYWTYRIKFEEWARDLCGTCLGYCLEKMKFVSVLCRVFGFFK
ncbi:hypothetical protein CPB85DRAFT_275045 [Mucidula mucida]|nr:hypothetical protein CPB85DRAFT_275045 [Mucidula mucida]